MLKNTDDLKTKQEFFNSLYDKLGGIKFGKVFVEAISKEQEIIPPEEFFYREMSDIPQLKIAIDAFLKDQRKAYIDFYSKNIHLLPKEVIVDVFARLGCHEISMETINYMFNSLGGLKP